MHIFWWKCNTLKCYRRVPQRERAREGNAVCVCVGAQCCVALHSYAEAVQWCDEGLKAHPADKKLLELRASADKHRVCVPLNIHFVVVVVVGGW